MVIVGIDSMVLIYAGIVPRKPDAAPFPPELAESAKVLFQILSRENCKIVLPTISIAELLVPVPPSRKAELIEALKKRFFCRPFDEQTAAIASDIWAMHNAQKPDDKYGKGERDVLKADAMIVAVAKAAGASRFYTHDGRCRKLASLVGMQGCHIPTRDPDSLFSPKELEEARAPIPKRPLRRTSKAKNE